MVKKVRPIDLEQLRKESDLPISLKDIYKFVPYVNGVVDERCPCVAIVNMSKDVAILLFGKEKGKIADIAIEEGEDDGIDVYVGVNESDRRNYRNGSCLEISDAIGCLMGFKDSDLEGLLGKKNTDQNAIDALRKIIWYQKIQASAREAKFNAAYKKHQGKEGKQCPTEKLPDIPHVAETIPLGVVLSLGQEFNKLFGKEGAKLRKFETRFNALFETPNAKYKKNTPKNQAQENQKISLADTVDDKNKT
jgi:hypothetical protein